VWRTVLKAVFRQRVGSHAFQLGGANFDDFTWAAADRQIDGTAANAAVFDQILFSLRSIDFQGKGFPTMWTGNISRHRQLHL
jgi:hypothetical protein